MCFIGFVDLFEYYGWWLLVSINLVMVYDGFMLYDLVSYNDCYNEVNGEDNCDGYLYNFFSNYGVEGEIDDLVIFFVCVW